jgi:hypothetical protein
MAVVTGSSCYALAELDQGYAVPDEFDPAILLAWSDRLTGLGDCQAVVGLILKLDAMSRLQMSGCDRALLLHLLEGPVQWVFDSRPRLTPAAIRATIRNGWDLTMEQRLACVVYRNLSRALRDLDDVPSGPGEQVAETRLWLLEQQFVVLDHQVRYAIRARLSPPTGTWIELHGRYRYVVQSFASGNGTEPRAGLGNEFDPLPAYKRLLLLGIAAGPLGDEASTEGFAARLRAWTAETGLEAPGAAGPSPGAWVVDLASDGPPYQADGSSDLPSGCVLLFPPPGFVTLVHPAGPRAETPSAEPVST